MRKHYFLLLHVLIACFSIQISAQVNLQQGLVAYYPFNGNANDESGNGNHGVVYGASLTEDRFGNANSAYYFNGIDNYIDPPYPTLNSQSFSLSMWFKTDGSINIGINESIFGGRSSHNWNPIGTSTIIYNMITWQYDTLIVAQIMGLGGGIRPTVSEEISVYDQNWYHWLVTSSHNKFKLYLNSELIGEANQTTSGNLTPFGVIGAYSDKNIQLYHHFAGIIDDVRFYNRPLTYDEVLALYYENQPQQTNTISNILINQRNDGSGMVDVYFNLYGTGSQYNITLEASFDGGNTYTTIPVSFLSGDVSNISPGTNKHIVWDGLGSHPNTYSTSTKLKIILN